MNITVNIHPTEATPEGFAPVDLRLDDGSKLCRLDLQYSVLARLPLAQAEAVDFLLIASAVYVADKLVIRAKVDDAWARPISLTCPVSDVPRWDAVKGLLTQCLSFLTGDSWTLHFAPRGSDPVRPRAPKRVRKLTPFNEPLASDAVSLFSGGLDSLVGVIDWLEENPQRSLLLVGHHERGMTGPYGDQKKLLTSLRSHYPGRLRCMLARVGHADEASDATEITLRGRSLIFMALGAFAASAIGRTTPLLIPENGTIALNVPLTPSRRGSCSTRTAHPHYLSMLADVLAEVGLANPISNPLRHKTKGEVLRDCRNLHLLSQTARNAVSCAKRGHKRNNTRRTASSCGRCMPCIYRRAAMHVLGWDDEVYGDDICAGEVDLDAKGKKPNDLRACISFLKQNHRQEDVASMLIANGTLDVRGLPADAAMVNRTMDEIRALLREKGTPEMKRLVGL